MGDVTRRHDTGQASEPVRKPRERFRFTVDTTDPAAVRAMAGAARCVARELRNFLNDALARRGRRRFSRRYLREVVFTRLRKLEALLDALERDPALHANPEGEP